MILLSATIEGVPLEALAPSALAGLAVLMVLIGQLIPRKTYKEVVHDRNEWRAESRIKDAQIAEKDVQLQHLSEVGETQKAVLHAVAQLGERGRRP